MVFYYFWIEQINFDGSYISKARRPIVNTLSPSEFVPRHDGYPGDEIVSQVPSNSVLGVAWIDLNFLFLLEDAFNLEYF